MVGDVWLSTQIERIAAVFEPESVVMALDV